DTRAARRQLLAELLLEHAELPWRLVHLDPPVLDQRQAGRIVATVFEMAQPVDQEWGRLPRPGVAYDAAHTRRPSSTSSRAAASDRPSAMSRLIGSVFGGRAGSPPSRPGSRHPACASPPPS